MGTTIILGDGGLGQAVATAYARRGDDVRMLGRPRAGRHDPGDLADAGLVVEASRAEAVVPNLAGALAAGARHVVIATTGWTADEPTVESLLREHGVAAVASPNFSLGVALFGRLRGCGGRAVRPGARVRPLPRRVAPALEAGPPVGDGGRARPADRHRHPALATTDDLEVVSIRAGASPGMHMVAFDAPGETVELRLTARDRSAYAAGILAAGDWLAQRPRAPGHPPLRQRRRRAPRGLAGRRLTASDTPRRTPMTRPALPWRLHRARHSVHSQRRP